jgi:hypothetical protein
MKANQIQSPGGTEVLKLIAASNGVRKLGPKEGRTKQVGDLRLTWKATGEDTGYAISFYEMDLPPGKGIPLHSHPYAEVGLPLEGEGDGYYSRGSIPGSKHFGVWPLKGGKAVERNSFDWRIEIAHSGHDSTQ